MAGAVEDILGYASLLVVSPPDFYGGKLYVAPDRQHLRDSHDVKLLLDVQGLNRLIFDGFIVYLFSHNWPPAETLSPRWRKILLNPPTVNSAG